MTGEEKTKFRKTKNWKDFKNKMDKLQPMDQLTNKKLSKRHQLHHLNLDPKKYTELKEENFTNLNPESHKVIHWIYSRYCRDPKFMARLIDIINRMIYINEGRDISDYLKIERVKSETC